MPIINSIKMGQDKKFSLILPAIAGARYSTLKKVCEGNDIPWSYKMRYLAVKGISLFGEPFRWFQDYRFGKKLAEQKIEEAPIFVLGHWRSGTTHLHNILSQDPQMGYVTTFQSVFPEVLLGGGGNWLFKNFMHYMMPNRRPGDNVVMDVRFPQEEEFALGNMHPFCYYYFWYFPHRIKEYYQKYVRFEGVTNAEIKQWQEDYKKLIKIALLNTKGKRFISKNPPNTGRIKQLLALFPNAKFIHIYRNPTLVYLSTRKFFNQMMPHLLLQKISDKEIDQSILDQYKTIMNDYLEDRHLIPEGNLAEVRFEELEANPMEVVENIYYKLGLPGYVEAEPAFEHYIGLKKGYKKNRHSIPKPALDRVTTDWDFAMKKWEYGVPESLEVI